MVNFDGIDDFIVFAVFFGNIGTNSLMRSFNFMVDCFAYVMKNAGPLCKFYVYVKFSGYDAGKVCYFS